MIAFLAKRKSFLDEPRHVVATLRVLVLAGLTMLGLSERPEQAGLYWFTVAIYGITNIGYLYARNRDYDLKRVKWLIFLFDVVVVSMLIVLRGSEVTDFLTAYFTLVLMAAIVDGLGNAFFNAIFVSVLYTALSNWGGDVHSLITFENMSQFVFFFVVAIFMGHVAEGARSEQRERRAVEIAKKRVDEALRSTSSELRQSTAELKAAREALRSNDRLATIGMLSAGIAHELKNPIAAILASVEEAPMMLEEIQEHIAKGEPLDDLMDELGEAIADSSIACRQLQRIVMDLNDMVRGGQSRSRSVRADEPVDSASRIVRKAAGERIQIETRCEATRAVKADPGRLMQVLINLAKNAIDAMKSSGGTRLRIATEDRGIGRVAFLVEDNGPGIPEDVRKRMFEPFFTTKGPGEGTGLGLHLVGEIVKSQSGTISCDTELGRGTTFTVEFPAMPQTTSGDTSHDQSDADLADRGRRRDDPPRAQANPAA